jgi:O-antigen ligase
MKKSLAAVINNSKIISSFMSPDRIHELWARSLIYRFFNFIVNSPVNLMRKAYFKWEDVFKGSLLMRLLKYITDNLYVVIGLFLIVNIIVPDHRWYNAYGVILTFMLFILFLFKLIMSDRGSINIKDVDYSLIIFFISIFVAAVTSLFPRDSLNYLIYYFITFMTIIIIVSSINTYEELYRLVKLLLIGVFITALYGAYQWLVVGIQVNPSLTDLTINQGMGGRVYSTMGNPNVYGELLVLTIPFFGTIILNEKSWIKKAFWILLLMPIMVILLKTGSRSAWVAFAAAMFIFVFFWNKKLIPFLILVGVLAIPFLPDAIYKRIMTIFNPNDTSLKYRQMILGPAFAMLKDYWLTGVGLGNRVFATIYQRYKSFGLTTVAHTHNLFVQLWLEAGIAAILSLLVLLFRMIKLTFNAAREKKNPKLNNILFASLSAVLGLCIMGLADHIWFYNRILFMFWINIAIILTSLKLKRQEI